MHPLTPLRVIRYSGLIALADLRAVYTWKGWAFGWLTRMLCQATFFALLGRAIDRTPDLHRLVIGNCVMLCAIETLQAIASTSWEQRTGTLPLLESAPAPTPWVFVGRSIQWPVSGCATTLVALFGLAPLFGVTWQPAQIAPAIGLVVVAALSTYCFGLFLAAAVFSIPSLRNITSNLAYLTMMALCGVQVPVTFWPSWAQYAAQALPLTHAVQAVQSLAAGDLPPHILARAALALLTAAGWLLAAMTAFTVLAQRGRRTGRTTSISM